MNSFDAAVRARAARVSAELDGQDEAWGSSGWTRRRFLAGVGMAGVAAMGSQLVTARAAYASTPSTEQRTVVVVFLRGAADGLRIVQPNTDDLGLSYLRQVRDGITLAPDELIALPDTGGWGINRKLAPLFEGLWSTGELGFVPGCSTPGVSRSHFQAQQWLEKGGSDTAASGWLERTLEQLGPGTTFRAVSEGYSRPMSLSGVEPSLALSSIADFEFPGWEDIQQSSQDAVLSLYRGMSGTLGADVPTTIAALATAETIRNQPATGVEYPDGEFGRSLKDIAGILRAEVGMQVATVDVGGWDTHTDEATDLDNNLEYTASVLRAFMDDLGAERRKRVTVVVMTEFGRRVAMNDSGGTDHGHGSLMWLLGGGLSHSDVFGKWTKLADSSLDDGDVPGVNHPFDVLGEVVSKRLGVTSLSGVFPGHTMTPLGVATET